MRTPMQAGINMASLIQRKQTQVSRDVGIGMVAAYMGQFAARIAAAGFVGPVAIADALTGRGWKSVGQQFANALIGLASTVRLQSGVFQAEVLTQTAKFNSLYAPAPAGFAAYLPDLGTRVEDECFPILARDWTTDATTAWDAATSRVVS